MCNLPCDLVHGHFLSYYITCSTEETPGCKFLFRQNSQFGHYTSVLTFVSPTVNDTGEFKCGSDPDSYALYIDVGELLFAHCLLDSGM